MDVEEQRVGQTYVDPTIEKDIPPEIAAMLARGWRHTITYTTPVSSVKFAFNKILKLSMEHIAKHEKDKKTLSLIRPLNSEEDKDYKPTKASTMVSQSSWWYMDPTGEMTLRTLQKRRRSTDLFKKRAVTILGAQLQRLQKLLYMHLYARLREFLHPDDLIRLETFMTNWRDEEDARRAFEPVAKAYRSQGIELFKRYRKTQKAVEIHLLARSKEEVLTDDEKKSMRLKDYKGVFEEFYQFDPLRANPPT